MTANILWIGLGIALLYGGAEILVMACVSFARRLKISPLLIGLTIVAYGTSMPELATSVVASLRKNLDIALGNIVGSNVFNILAILGLAATISPMQSAEFSAIHIAVRVGLSFLLLPLIWSNNQLNRWEGGILLIVYGVYFGSLLL
ncbi:MAG TPA: hypothetical protein PKW76_12145 [bacterium]|nr:hypothetical protein [bacterium]HPG46424.1 hypothetical protein [bacterium]HPM98663.1 hypothetical protein [bacterium]